jgi:hypothetical protein
MRHAEYAQTTYVRSNCLRTDNEIHFDIRDLASGLTRHVYRPSEIKRNIYYVSIKRRGKLCLFLVTRTKTLAITARRRISPAESTQCGAPVPHKTRLIPVIHRLLLEQIELVSPPVIESVRV